MLLLNVAVLLQSIFQISGQSTIQPYGPQMCDMLCQRTKGCSDYIFDEGQLSCQLVTSEPASTTSSPGQDTEDSSVPMTQSRTTALSGIGEKREDNSCPDKDGTDEKDFIELCSSGELGEVMKQVHEGKVDINCRDIWQETCVMEAASRHNTEMFDFLVKNGCDLSAVSEEKRTVLHYACVGGSIEMVKKLVDDHKSDIHFRDNDGKTPLLFATSVPVLKFLMFKGADYRAVDNDNNNILHLACIAGRLDSVKYILSLKIFDLECKGENGKTPLQLAIRRQKRSVIHFLRKMKN